MCTHVWGFAGEKTDNKYVDLRSHQPLCLGRVLAEPPIWEINTHVRLPGSHSDGNSSGTMYREGNGMMSEQPDT